MGRMPTTRAMAGTVSGIKQMNSMTRLRPGRRSRTQTMVGSTSTSMTTEVIAASSSDAMIASPRPGVVPMAVQALRVRGALTLFPRVENSNMAPIGPRKKAPRTTKTTMRKIWSLRRRERFNAGSPQPMRCAPLEQRVKDHHDEDDHDHGQCQRFGETRLARPCLTGEQGLDLQGHDYSALGNEGRSRGVRGKRVGEQKQRAS